VVPSRRLGSSQLALLDPLQDNVRLYRAESCRLARGVVVRLVVGYLGVSGIYGFHIVLKL
jgi:hypothetical protein